MSLPCFAWLVAAGFQRPFELATVRLRNMNEVLSKWGTYVPNNAYITQRGGTFLLDEDDSVSTSTATRASWVLGNN